MFVRILFVIQGPNALLDPIYILGLLKVFMNKLQKVDHFLFTSLHDITSNQSTSENLTREIPCGTLTEKDSLL